MAHPKLATVFIEPMLAPDGEGPSLKRSGIHQTGSQRSRPEVQPTFSHYQTHGLQPFEPRSVDGNITFPRLNVLQDEDLLDSLSQLQNSPQLVCASSGLPRKSPSTQELTKMKRGSLGWNIGGRSKTGPQIEVPDKWSPRSIVTDPLLYDESATYVCTSSHSGDSRTTHNFGAIGDQRPPHADTLSAQLVCNTRTTSPTRSPATTGPLKHCTLHDLVVDSIPDVVQDNLLTASAGADPSTPPLAYDARTLLTQGTTPFYNLRTPMLHDPVHCPAPDFDRYGLLVAGETDLPSQAIEHHRVVPSKSPVGTRRRSSLTDLNVIPDVIPTQTDEHCETSASHYDEQVLSDAQILDTQFQIDGASEEMKILRAPVWQRNGPPFASSIRPEVRLTQKPQFLAGPLQPALDDSVTQRNDAFQDKLDPVEFSLPYGSVVYSMKSNNIKNLQISITKSIWTSTLGSNIVLTEAWERRKSEEKIILLFSITHSTNHSGKYLGMAEMVGPLDVNADCEFWTEKKNGTQGSIPIRWIVTKDVPFARFYDLRYHEQHVTQVRHGNTIPGEVGRLVIQRYFEAAHSATATLHPLSQTVHDMLPTQTRYTKSPNVNQTRGSGRLVHRYEPSRGVKLPGGRGGRGGFVGGHRVDLQARKVQRESPDAPNSALKRGVDRALQPVPGRIESGFQAGHFRWHQDGPPSAVGSAQGVHSLAFRRPSQIPSGVVHGTMAPNGDLFRLGDRRETISGTRRPVSAHRMLFQ